jgi:hypothetical protein
MIDRATFDRIRQRHGGYASWAIWAEATGMPKSNMGDMRVLDPDRNRTLLATLRNDVVMVGLNISRPFSEPFRNFHDASAKGQDYKIRYAFAHTRYYGAYMTDFIKGVVMLESHSLMRHVRENPFLLRENVAKLLLEFDDLQCEGPTILTFGGDTFRLVASNLPRQKYSRLVPIMHYSNYISQEKYKEAVLKQIASGPEG